MYKKVFNPKFVISSSDFADILRKDHNEVLINIFKLINKYEMISEDSKRLYFENFNEIDEKGVLKTKYLLTKKGVNLFLDEYIYNEVNVNGKN